MHISKFSRISTTVCPGSYASVVYVSEGDGPGTDALSVADTLSVDRESLDLLAVDSEDSDPLAIPGIHKLLKSIKPAGLECMMVTEGNDPAALDDLVGAGYVDSVCFRICGNVSDAQKACIATVRDAGCRFAVSVPMVPGRIDGDVLADIAKNTEGCRQFVMRSSDPRYGTEVFKKKELEALAKTVRSLTKHPVLM